MPRDRSIRSRSAFSTAVLLLLAIAMPSSPSGAKLAAAPTGTIVFASGEVPPGGGIIERSIYTIDADGTGRTRLTTGYDAGAPDWSPDGTKLVFTADPDGDWMYHLYVMNADGSGVEQLTFGDYDEMAPAWSPDGTHIAFSRRLGAENYMLVNMASDASSEIDIAPGGMSPSWSPDGNKIVFSDWDSNRLKVVNSDGSGLKKLIDGSGMGYEQSPAWSPDGDWIAFVGGGEVAQIHLVKPNGGGLKQMTSGNKDKWDPTWSPDGTRLAYTEDYTSMKTAKTDGSGTTTVISSGADNLSDLSWYGTGDDEPDPNNPHGCTLFVDTPNHVTFMGTQGDDIICGDSTWDEINGAGGNDTIYGEGQTDFIFGGTGNDTLYGGDNYDKLFGGDGRDHAFSGAGNDWLRDTDGERDVLNGGPGNSDCAWVDKKDVVKNIEIVYYDRWCNE